MILKPLTMPRHCVAAGCDTISRKGYSFHKFPKDAVKWHNWDGPLSDSQLCSKHFQEDCFITEEVRFHEEIGIPTVKCLKPDTIPTIFTRSVDFFQASISQCNTPTSQPLSERRQQRSMRPLHVHSIFT